MFYEWCTRLSGSAHEFSLKDLCLNVRMLAHLSGELISYYNNR